MRTYIEMANLVATDETKSKAERLRLWKHYVQLAYETKGNKTPPLLFQKHVDEENVKCQ